MLRVLNQFLKRHETFQIQRALVSSSKHKFSTSPEGSSTYNQEVKPEFLHEPSLKTPLQKICGESALEFGRALSKGKKEESLNFFDKSVYLKGYASSEFEEWKEFYKLYIKSLVDQNPTLLDKKAERNLISQVEKFLKRLNESNLQVKVLEPKEVEYNINLLSAEVIKDVMIDRDLLKFLENRNLESKEELLNLKKGSFYETELKSFDNVKKFSRYSVNQYYVTVETNARVVLVKNDGIIYGPKDESWETHTMIIENRRNYFKKYPYFLVDFDFVLNKNVHKIN